MILLRCSLTLLFILLSLASQHAIAEYSKDGRGTSQHKQSRYWKTDRAYSVNRHDSKDTKKRSGVASSGSSSGSSSASSQQAGSAGGGNAAVSSGGAGAATSGSSAGGSLKGSIESIRQNAPISFTAQRRLVTAEDYTAQILANYGSFLDDVTSFGGADNQPPEFGKVFVGLKFKSNIADDTQQNVKDTIFDINQEKYLFLLKLFDRAEIINSNKINLNQ